jgi:hypothetical protein
MATQKQIESTLSRSVCGGWDRSFLESILEQTAKGRTLSSKQRQTLGKVLARNTEEDQRAHEGWASVYDTQYKKDASVLAAYHAQQPYYRDLARDILSGEVPERSKFLRMYDNKYSKKVMTQYHAPPKYTVGDYLCPRASLDSHRHIELEETLQWARQNAIIQNFKKRGGFVMEILTDIRSCAKGAKRYKLLPIGATVPLIVEERFIKRGKRT